jgi:hypothetical protein
MHLDAFVKHILAHMIGNGQDTKLDVQYRHDR